MRINELQLTIKAELNKLGWSMSDFVKEYDKFMKYKSGLNDGAFKKQLSRVTTQPGLLLTYLKFIQTHDAWIKLGKIRPVCTSNGEFSAEFNDGMGKISEMITKNLENDL